MTEFDAMKLAKLQLDGEAREWRYHGLVTMGHSNITSYTEFTQRHIECFDRKDLELHFKEMAELNETDSLKAYILESERIAITVIDISEVWLGMLFVEGPSEPLCGWVKDYQPATLHDAVNRARDMQDVICKSRFPPKPSFPQRSKEVKPYQKEGIGKPKLDEDTRKE